MNGIPSQSPRRIDSGDRAPPPAAGPRSLALRLAAVAAAVAAVALVLNLTGALDQLSFAGLARNREWLAGRVQSLGHAAPLAFILVYALCTAFSLPTGLLLSTLGGFLFGTLWGGLYIVVGATLGATMLFLAARTVLGDALRARAGPALQRLEAGFRENALGYMLALRLVPLFPFWLVNLAPAFLGVPTATFVIGTFVGIVPGSLVFASVGTGLDAILAGGGTPDGSVLLQPRVLLPIGGLAVLALIPAAVKRFRRRPAPLLEQSP
ncbi:MAG TPA: TVP38/TMEM64 family protein [Alphaproteobacteria bacterium]|nr:TVP38/TMEM64 family protein [Alphaproteobacteria bacterium]